ncbi:RING/U-box superfamily protein [Euphorbia peplus]|nr:RING/U-box superfamily protein [Euphorbia peplus]
MVHFPNYGDLIVKSISYSDKILQLADPNSCVHEVLLNLNLTSTPFRYYYVVKNYTYLNCSTRPSNSASFVEIPCLSGSKHHVYSGESWIDVPVFCREIKSVDVPFSYSPYLSDNSFGLALTWSQQQNKGLSNKQWSLGHKLLKAELCFILSLAILALLGMKKIYHSRKEKSSNPLEEQLRFFT